MMSDESILFNCPCTRHCWVSCGKATDSWALNIDRGLINAIVFLDLNKAFDTVDHEIVILSFIRTEFVD